MSEQIKKVLVIDDNEVIRKLTSTQLSKKNYLVKTAENGQAGIDIARCFQPHVILLDVMMPELDGYAVCEKLKASDETMDIPIIMLTGKTESVDKIKGLEKGASDYVTKPFDHGELLARVATHVKIKIMWDDLQEKNRMLHELSRRDELTGLHNYRHFMERISYEFNRSNRYNLPLCCVILDLDYFKKVNDSYGHQAGDFVLREVAKITRESIREIDLAARYGGEEFALILPHTKLENALCLCERIRMNVESRTFNFNNYKIKNTVSLGVVSRRDNNPESYSEMIKFADEALYSAKENGRNRVSKYNNKKTADCFYPVDSVPPTHPD